MTEKIPEENVHGIAPKQQTLLKSSLVMASGTLVSRMLGFVRSALLVAALGASAGAMGSFQVANTLPNMVYNLLAAGIIDAVLIPQIVRALKGRAGSQYVNKLLTAAGSLLFLLTVLAMVATPVIVTILASAYSPEMRSLTITFALICVPQIFFYGLYNLLGELLNARGIFGPYMWAPVVNNIFGIASLLLFLSLWGKAGDIRAAESMTPGQILVVAGMATLGVIAQALVLLIPLRKSGLKLRLDFRFKGTSFGSASKVAFWTFATLLISQFAVVSTSQLATRADAYTEATGILVAGNPAYQFAYMIYMVPSSLIALTLATAIFTRLANDVADGNIQGVASNYHRGVELIVLLSFYAAAVLMVAATPVMQVIMPTQSATSATLYGMVLVTLMFALPAAGLTIMSQRVFFAFENAKPVFIIAIAPIILQLIIGWSVYFLADAKWWTVGAAAGETVYRIVQGFVSLAWAGYMVRQINIGRVVVFYLRSMLAFAISALVAWGVLHLIGPTANTDSILGRFLDGTWKSVLVAVIVAIVYFGFLQLADPRGMNAIIGALVARFRPRTTTPEPPLEPGVEIDSEEELHASLAEAALRDLDDAERPQLPTAQVYPVLPQPQDEDERVGRELPQAARWGDAPPQWDDIFGTATLTATGATSALARGMSPLDMPATGAIPILSGPIPQVSKNPKTPVSLPVVDALLTPEEDVTLHHPPVATPPEDTDSADDSHGNVEDDESDKDTEMSSQGHHLRGTPVSSNAGKKDFNPTVPALIVGFVLVVVAAYFAVTTLMGSRPGLLEGVGETGGTGASQSSQSGEEGAEQSEEKPEETAPPAAVPVITSATIFSWNDDDGDHPELSAAILDADPGSVWRSRYFTENAFQPGSEIAILLSFAEPAVVSEVSLDVNGAGGEIIVLNASAGNPRDGEVLATGTANGNTVIKLAQPTEVSALGIKFNSLPVDDEGMNRAKISRIAVG
ncbi:murein biosynthesis integral membrane protein MurJ [Actinomyces minihominis]|uniref:murein biosynthesis integral membrane protein MurJ n=1 Tax=Actinomyces minihominis TaxID=2002838 RepID=UPI00101AD33C|nr:murein biosynthesis integral membrane protein MurJ [Actinomyces minihominis]